MAIEEPEGWRILQERARREKDPEKLAAIIDEMNQLLTEWEKRAAGGGKGNAPSDSRKGSAQE